MAAVLANLTVLLDGSHVNLPISPPDRNFRTPPIDIALNLSAKREIAHWYASPAAATSFQHDKDGRNLKAGLRGKLNAKVNTDNYENLYDDENGKGNEFLEEEDEDEKDNWEKIRRRVEELEEMEELVKKVEELQNRFDEEYPEENENNQESEEEKRARVKRELEKVAKEQAERRKTARLMFDLGQKAYGKGSYGRAVEFLEGALTIIPRPTLFGGEIQIWLAMAYEANNRHIDCIALYKQLERNHPSVSIRRQASELRYILQAPKLKITQEEMVTIPLIGSSYDSYAAIWSDNYMDKAQMQSRTTNQLLSSKDWLGDFLARKLPVGMKKRQTVWVALTLWAGLVAASFLQR
ncbi:unnamed protein product [Cuscuta epithymum]|uniref:Uncharacterized protein n=1 Tax=Cuscuta epithymum TaxID=186058 RepID=A0AAV0FWN7_9ASTE|nr:unnamed protein product [Cuscuta epithymum]